MEPVFLVTGLEAMENKLENRRLGMDVGCFFVCLFALIARVGKHWKTLSRGTVGSGHPDIQNAMGHVPEKLSLTGPPMTRGQTEDLQQFFPANNVLLHVSITCSDEVLSCF